MNRLSELPTTCGGGALREAVATCGAKNRAQGPLGAASPVSAALTTAAACCSSDRARDNLRADAGSWADPDSASVPKRTAEKREREE